MALRIVQVNIKAQDDAALGRFWADALGWGLDHEAPGVTNLLPEGVTWPDPAAVCIDLVQVPDPETVNYRVHLELGTGSAEEHAELVARLKQLGATDAEAADAARGDIARTVLADPEGNVFSVLEPQATRPGTGQARIATVVVDCTDPRALARFWDEALDWTLLETTDEYALLRSAKNVGPYLELRRTVGTTTTRSRIHIDVMPYAGQDQSAEVARLRTLGAVDVDLGQGEVSWAVLADTEGNEFCVLRAGG